MNSVKHQQLTYTDDFIAKTLNLLTILYYQCAFIINVENFIH